LNAGTQQWMKINTWLENGMKWLLHKMYLNIG
jgi:hypothetical protein